jgi:DUF2075 family protein
MQRYFYSNTIASFLSQTREEILGELSLNNDFALEQTQRQAWLLQIEILKDSLPGFDGSILFEYSIPRMGRRVDAILIIEHVVFVLEFKVGEKDFLQSAVDQVWDYALDLKNFHKPSHSQIIAPVLIATAARRMNVDIATTLHNDGLLIPVKANAAMLKEVIEGILAFADGTPIAAEDWIGGAYAPTPTIIEAAMALYNNHSVADISRTDASAINLSETSGAVSRVIEQAKEKGEKAICFVTGVPGAGKTLVGLDIATKHLDKADSTSSVFLSGNGPLVAILREALTRDKWRREKEKGLKTKKGEILREVKMFIQNVHHFRDECLVDNKRAPFDHVAIFDEAQRAWNHQQTAAFMLRKKNVPEFSYSEPEFLISCLDRHPDWAVIVCLVGGGQEINTGEAGISEWMESLTRSFPHWKVHISSRLTDSEYAAGNALRLLDWKPNVVMDDSLHLSVSMRSFRAEHLSQFVKSLLDLDVSAARSCYSAICEKYPLIITRDLQQAKRWLKQQARGNERYGIVVSSQAQRLKPYAIDVKSPMDPIHWFLDGKEDVRSSYYLEDVATEFHVQGLELDWACVTWDADFRYSAAGWGTYSFVGDKWQNVNKAERKQYLKNAYRVLLTRARQGMVIVVPNGDTEDVTRKAEYYDTTWEYLVSAGVQIL